MDDLLRAFQAEASQDLDRCDAALARLRTAPEGVTAIVNLQRLLGSIQEMSVVLGQKRLAEAASRGLGALDIAQAGGRDAVAKVVPVVSNCMAEMRALLSSLGYEKAIEVEATPALPSEEMPIESQTVAAGSITDPPAVTIDPPRRRWYRPRNLLFAAATSVFAASAALVIAVLATDPNEYRGMIEDAVRSATGRAVTIGDVGLELSLTPSVVLQDVTLANAAWGSRAQMVTADRLEVQMALLPLLRGEFDPKRFILRGADILLEDKDDKQNWMFEGGSGRESAGDGLTLSRLGRMAIEESRLSFRDAATGETETIEIERLTARQDEVWSPIELEIASTVNGQPVKLAGTIGALQLLYDKEPYPVELAGEVAGLATTVKGEVERPLEIAGFALDLNVSGMTLAGLGAMTASDLPPGSPIRLSAKAEDAAGGIRFRDLSGQIGDSDLAGEVAVIPGEPNWRIDANLTSSNVDLQDFILPRTDDGPADPRLFSARPLPHKWIDKIDMDAKLAAQKVVRGTQTLTGAQLAGTITAGRLTLADARFGYAGGTVALKGTLDVTGAAPVWDLQASARKLRAGEFLGEVLGLSLIGGGQADIEATLSASGASARELAMTADGTVGLGVTGASINDDLMKLFLTDLEQALSFDGGGAQLRCLTAVHAFKDGIGRSRQFVADTGAVVVVGQGGINLRDETIAMRFEPSARELSLGALPVPVDVSGPLVNPDVTPDALGATANVASEAASIATLGVADTLLGIVGEAPLSNSGPLASCAPLPAALTSTKSKKTQDATKKTQDATSAESTTQQATTATTTKKKSKKRKSTSAEQLLDDIGTGLGEIFDGSNSSNNSNRTRKSKDNK